MIITIDGPAGTGKSTVALTAAERLGFDFLDAGAMYRAIGLEALRREADLNDPRLLTFVAKRSRIEFEWAKHPPGVSPARASWNGPRPRRACCSMGSRSGTCCAAATRLAQRHSWRSCRR